MRKIYILFFFTLFIFSTSVFAGEPRVAVQPVPLVQPATPAVADEELRKIDQLFGFVTPSSVTPKPTLATPSVPRILPAPSISVQQIVPAPPALPRGVRIWLPDPTRRWVYNQSPNVFVRVWFNKKEGSGLQLDPENGVFVSLDLTWHVVYAEGEVYAGPFGKKSLGSISFKIGPMDRDIIIFESRFPRFLQQYQYYGGTEK